MIDSCVIWWVFETFKKSNKSNFTCCSLFFWVSWGYGPMVPRRGHVLRPWEHRRAGLAAVKHSRVGRVRVRSQFERISELAWNIRGVRGVKATGKELNLDDWPILLHARREAHRVASDHRGHRRFQKLKTQNRCAEVPHKFFFFCNFCCLANGSTINVLFLRLISILNHVLRTDVYKLTHRSPKTNTARIPRSGQV